jgi:hypothetical protein
MDKAVSKPESQRGVKRLEIKLSKLLTVQNDIEIRLASTFAEYTNAMKMLYNEYKEKGLISKDKADTYFSPYLLIPNNVLIIAVKEDEIIGTISLIEDSPIGIPMENVHSEEIVEQRVKRNKFAEVGSLAMKNEYRHSGVTMLLFKAVFIYAYLHRHIDNILIAVHPRVSRFYQESFNFSEIGDVQEYQSLNNAKSVPLCMKVSDAIDTLRAKGIVEKNSNKLDVAQFFVEDDIYGNIPLETGSDIKYLPIWQEYHIKKYLTDCNVSIKNLPTKQRELIGWLYPSL